MAGARIGIAGGRAYAGFAIDGDDGTWWYGDFAPAQGDILLAGSTYPNARRYPFHGVGPGMEVRGNGRGCNTLTGSFTVTSADFDGRLRSIGIAVQQHCEGATGGTVTSSTQFVVATAGAGAGARPRARAGARAGPVPEPEPAPPSPSPAQRPPPPAARIVTRVDRTPPDTRITDGPPPVLRLRCVTFRFASTEARTTFQCRLEKRPWTSCRSPKTFVSLAKGRHRVLVRARDAAGNADPTPASRVWRTP